MKKFNWSVFWSKIKDFDPDSIESLYEVFKSVNYEKDFMIQLGIWHCGYCHGTGPNCRFIVNREIIRHLKEMHDYEF